MAGRGTADARIGLRVQRDLVRRITALRPRIARDPRIAQFGKVTESTVVRLALLRGLDALEADYLS